MRILHVSPGLQETCGVSNFVVESSRALQDFGHRVCIATTMTCGYPVDDLDVRLLDDPREIEFVPDVVHIHTLWNRYVHRAAGWCRQNRHPYIISPHGALTPWALRHKWWKKWPALLAYQYRDLRRAAGFHVTTPPETADLRRLRLTQTAMIAPLGVHIPNKAEPLAPRPGNMRNLLFLSRIHPVKGLDNLLLAWREIKKNGLAGTGANWRLLIVGPDDIGYKAKLYRQAVDTGIDVEDWGDRLSYGKKVITGGNEVGVAEFARHLAASRAELVFAGPAYHEAKDYFYRIADLFVLPSYSENFGGVVVDALAHGVPVITTKGTPWQELLGKDSHTPSLTAPGRCGWWIDIGVAPLADALAEAMAIPEETKAVMRQNGIRLVDGKYTWSAVAREMNKAYTGILNSENNTISN